MPVSSDLVLLSFNLSSSQISAFEQREPVHVQDSFRDDVPSTRLRFLVGRALVRYGLSELAEPAKVKIEVDALGRPFSPDLPSIDFNISHSGDWVLCLIGRERRVGVDVELIGALHDEVVERLAESEIAYIRSRSGRESVEAFYRVWTAKEAFLKADGRTFLLPLDSFSVSFSGGVPRLSTRGDGPHAGWNLESGALDSHHLYTICYSGRTTGCETCRVSPQVLSDFL